MRFENKICLVTGGGSGIGRATCIRLASEGGTVVVVDINEQHGNETASLIQQQKGNAMFVKTDVGVSAEIENCVKTVIDQYKRIDILVNDAAFMTFNKIVDLAESDWDKVMNINLKSVFLFCKYSLPYMKKGAVVNISSVHAFETTANVLPYAATKGGIEAFTRGLSLEYKSDQARFNCVAPGSVDTPMLWSNPDIKDGVEKMQGAIGKPEELAAAICFMASDEASFVNGTTLVVDGGRLDIL
ncbi:MAG: SDR family NAD(P)-dependent oxidoreductase [Mucilaginibacter sp.]|uniref:SDR family NAD(P)-dependent oxidoreductase n=1 Tax=Mucilaginibacter sp. TaxID=1882438 RepID=UPI0034E37CFB